MTRKTKNPANECPSFNVCSAPKCPLDPDIDIRVGRYPGEEKCRGTKPVRMRIGEKYKDILPYKGLFSREFKAKKRWNDIITRRKRENHQKA